jgi:hypothetical protein
LLFFEPLFLVVEAVSPLAAAAGAADLLGFVLSAVSAVLLFLVLPVAAQGCHAQALTPVQVAANCLAGQTHDLWL